MPDVTVGAIWIHVGGRTAVITLGLLLACGLLVLLFRGERRQHYWRRFRTMTVLIGVILSAAWVGDGALATLLGVVALTGSLEVWRLDRQPRRGSLLFAMLVASLPVVAWYGDLNHVVMITVAVLVLTVGVTLVQSGRFALLPVGTRVLALFYVGVPCALMMLLREHGGFGAFVFYFAVVQLADLGGYLGGRSWGRHPLVPALSPGKTWEGLATGTATACLGALLFGYAVPGWTGPELLLVGLSLTVVALFGDLFASWLKRLSNRKDFGSLLPGHGGVLDRFDSYLFSAPLACWLLIDALPISAKRNDPGGANALLIGSLGLVLAIAVPAIWSMNRNVRQRVNRDLKLPSR